jgi:hypothetical protein
MMGTIPLGTNKDITCRFAHEDSAQASLDVKLRPASALRAKPTTKPKSRDMAMTTVSETQFGTCHGVDKHLDRWLPK